MNRKTANYQLYPNQNASLPNLGNLPPGFGTNEVGKGATGHRSIGVGAHLNVIGLWAYRQLIPQSVTDGHSDARPTVTSPASEHHHPSTSIIYIYSLVAESGASEWLGLSRVLDNSIVQKTCTCDKSPTFNHQAVQPQHCLNCWMYMYMVWWKVAPLRFFVSSLGKTGNFMAKFRKIPQARLNLVRACIGLLCVHTVVPTSFSKPL